MKEELVFELGAEGGGIDIKRQKDANGERFICNYVSNDFTDEGYDVYETTAFATFEEVFTKVRQKAPYWFRLYLITVHKDYKEYVIQQLLKDLKEQKVLPEDFYSKKRFEEVLNIKLKYDKNYLEWDSNGILIEKSEKVDEYSDDTEEIYTPKLDQMWNGYCPESWLEGKQVRMRLNRNDFYESEATGLQIAVLSGVQAIILNFRGKGDFRSTPTYADEIENGELLSPQNISRPPFNNPTEIFENSEEIENYIKSIKKETKKEENSSKSIENMDKITLNDILKLEDLSNVKIRFNLSNDSWNALEHYHNDREKLLIGNFHNSENRKWFKENEIVIGLAEIRKNEWLLIDISRITKDHNVLSDGTTSTSLYKFYDHEPIEKYKKYFGRVIIQFPKTNAFVTLKGDRIDEFIVKEILQDKLDNDFFPGYDKINLSWENLKRVLQKESWKTALENQKGVYLITDTSNGKMYVGSAYGKDMILGRWTSYIENGHGGNIELKELPFEHIKKHFRYTILDIYKYKTDDRIITEREKWWKKILQTGQFGYNRN
ncbi:MAG: GIY-YIG nuclease family protein [Capnocytophaga sp.]|nr:GIY-YIG nuclease family protein [Capnocytophaga sp.]